MLRDLVAQHGTSSWARVATVPKSKKCKQASTCKPNFAKQDDLFLLQLRSAHAQQALCCVRNI